MNSKFNLTIFLLAGSLVVTGCDSISSQCGKDKADVIQFSLEYYMALFNGARGQSVPGRLQAISSMEKAKKSCNNSNLTYQDIYVEALKNNKDSSKEKNLQFLAAINTPIE